MLNTVKDAMHTIGDSTEDFAKRFGSEAADIAKMVGSEAAHLAKKVSHDAADLAKSFGSGTADLAKRIGPKRAIIGVAVLGVLVGGSIWLVRYLRARKEDLPADATQDQAPNRGQKRHGKRGAEHYSH